MFFWGFQKLHFESLTMATVDEYVITNVEATSKADLGHAYEKAGAALRLARNLATQNYTTDAIQLYQHIMSVTESNHSFDAVARLTRLDAVARLTKLNEQFHLDHVRFAVRVPHGTTEIEEEAFDDSENVVSVELPATIISIGNSAFAQCSNLSRYVCILLVLVALYNTFGPFTTFV